MTSTAEPVRRRFEPPLAVQIVVLICACLIVAQVATALVVVFLPPPPPPIYHLGEVAEALRGRNPHTIASARPLVRTISPIPPSAGHEDAAARRGLAAILGVPEADVRLNVSPPSPLGRISAEAGMWPFPWPGGRGDRPRGPPRFGRRPPWAGEDDPGMPVFGRFAAALRTAPGYWSVVTPEHEAFPNPWQRRVLAWLALGFLFTAPLGYLFARRLTAPLGRFAGAARQFGSDPSAPLMQLEGPAEIGEAAHAFNDMQRRLKRFIDDRTAMVGAISHDLRTPLARMRFKLERADPQLKASLAHDLDQMQAMIASVLDFIRDARAERSRAVLDLASVVECAIDDAAAAGGEIIVLGEVERLAVDGDPLALQRLFANLLDNAVKYGGLAEVAVTRHGGEAMVRIIDRGPGIRTADLERVFEPFYRGDASRNLDLGGMGLGLAVARSVAREHGGDVVLTSSDHGLTATVWLPLAARC